MQHLLLAVITTLLFGPFIMALPTPPVGYPTIAPPGYGRNGHLVDQINHQRLATGKLGPVYQIGHFNGYNPPPPGGQGSHASSSTQGGHGGHGAPGTHGTPGGYHGVPTGYGRNGHHVDEINSKRLSAGLAPAYQLGHFNPGQRHKR